MLTLKGKTAGVWRQKQFKSLNKKYSQSIFSFNFLFRRLHSGLIWTDTWDEFLKQMNLWVKLNFSHPCPNSNTLWCDGCHLESNPYCFQENCMSHVVTKQSKNLYFYLKIKALLQKEQGKEINQSDLKVWLWSSGSPQDNWLRYVVNHTKKTIWKTDSSFFAKHALLWELVQKEFQWNYLNENMRIFRSGFSCQNSGIANYWYSWKLNGDFGN